MKIIHHSHHNFDRSVDTAIRSQITIIIVYYDLNLMTFTINILINLIITFISINSISLNMMMIISGLDAGHVAHYIAEQEVIALQG